MLEVGSSADGGDGQGGWEQATGQRAASAGDDEWCWRAASYVVVGAALFLFFGSDEIF